ncbi:polyamine-transporting ATPase 13A3-like isoform X2 [Oppia nitens]|uniref:polyamine-transporting ATPase 13A3-like isoform X2 n=1 Tax=Oppia nitens TaxID=1686743 RepID=UPI0023D98216|nr:polyamine-transporting ATPase 13A3-like isoform X2 [Oppia nitens]
MTKSDVNNKSQRVGPPPIRYGINYVNPEEEDQMEIYGFKPDFFRTFITWIGIIMSCGLLRLVFHWKPHWMLSCTHVRCPLDCAKKVLLIDQFLQKFTEDIKNLSTNLLQYQYSQSTESLEVAANNSETTNSLVIPKPRGVFESTNSLTYFENKKVRYVWDSDERVFFKVRGLDSDIYCSYFYQQKGLTADEQETRRILYDENAIVVEIKTIFQILIQEVLEPFYIFQIFSLLVWGLDEYYYYAACIVIMSALSLTSSVIQTRRNQKQLRDTVQGMDTINVCRGNDIYEEIESSKLVPGDLIEVPAFGCIMQCDAVLLTGNVIVNESMLTGESVPVTKTPLPNTTTDELYDTKEHAKHTIFCGTKVIQTRYYNNAKVKAVIIRTAYQTAKGELIRSIMFPKPVDFKLNRHIHKFIGCLAVLSFIGFLYTVVLKTIRGVPWHKIVLKALDLITIVIPPALPAAMTIGVVFAQSRLRRSNIFCISPRSINISGCINCVCFDKTGTLTEDDLNFAEVVPVDIDKNKFDSAVDVLTDLDYGPLLVCLASCHSLTIIDDNIIGDTLDQKMFYATEWILEEPQVSDTTKYDLLAPTVVKPNNKELGPEVGILRQFPFSSSLQRMSVVTRMTNGTEFELYAKGSPEIISSLCDPNSLPEDFTDTLMEYTEKGFRVLALAYRPLPALTYPKLQRAGREDLEKNLQFLGLLIMGNMLKPETTPIIETLLSANIRTVMITGDNMLTALSVARECNMIQPYHKVVLLEPDSTGYLDNSDEMPTLVWKFANPVTKRRTSIVNFKLVEGQDNDRLHVAITGRTFKILRDHYPDLLNKVAIRGTVFSRMAPEQKQQLVELLQELGYIVGMCGDGANDMASLKQAHAGVSLSEAEASVASPFTSKTPDISCIPILIREGRASIVTSFGILKYMALYSLTQFFSVIILYTFYSNLTDKEFLYEDLFLITLFVTLFGRSEAFDQLNRKPPPSSLIGITPLSSIALQILLVAFIQVIAIVIVWQQYWYRPHVTSDPEDLASHDNYAIFASSVFQYITLSVVFSKGAPYRKPIYTNHLFTLALVLLTILTIYLVVYPTEWIAEFLELDIRYVPYNFRILMVLLAVAHFILAFFAESFIVDFLVFKKLRKWFPSLSPSESLYKEIDNETKHNTRWLPNPLAAYNKPHRRNGSTFSSSINQNAGSELLGKSSPPESGVWTQSQASSVSPIVLRGSQMKHELNN